MFSLFFVVPDHLHQEFGSLEFDAIMLELEKKDGIADLKKCSTEVREFHNPKVLPMGPLDLASPKRIHMGADYLHHFVIHSETLGVLGSDNRVTIGFKGGKMIVMKQSCKGTHFQIRTKKPRKLICEERSIEKMFVAIEKHMVPMILEFPEVLIVYDMSNNTTKLFYMKMRVIR